MTARASFIASPYSAYHHRDVPQPDPELTRVGPGTPCGEYLRRFWQPVCTSAELQDLPKRIRILGEDLIAFRDHGGQVGLLELHCSHRGTSLEFGQISQRGIRCCYHGWLFDVDGRILETPGEPPESTLKERLCHGAYPVQEHGGMVFAYMGPPEKKPAFPIYDTFEVPGYYQVADAGYIWPCNWLQVKENSMDPAHLSFLHTIPGNEGFTQDLKELGIWDFVETPIGMIYMDTRRRGDRVWVRLADYICPNLHQFPPNTQSIAERTTLNLPRASTWTVPIDDTHTMQIGFRRAPDPRQLSRGIGFGQLPDRPYEARQRTPGDYDAQSSQRPIAVHGLEHLASTDRGVTALRNMVRKGIRAVQHGEDPKGVMREEGRVLPTYANDTVVEAAPAPTPEADNQLMRDIGRKVAQEFIKNPPTLSLTRS